MATNPLDRYRNNPAVATRQIDPLNNPYFGTMDRANPTARPGTGYSLGNADGSGFYDFSKVNPDSAIYRPRSDDSGNVGAIDPQALQAWLSSKGLTMQQADDPGTNKSARWLQDSQGNLVGDLQEFDNDDDAFALASLAAAAIATGGVAMAGAGAGAGAGGMAGAAGTAGTAAGGAGAGGMAGAVGTAGTGVATAGSGLTLGSATSGAGLSLGGTTAAGTATGLGSTGLGITGGAGLGTTLGTAGAGLTAAVPAAGQFATGLATTGLGAAGAAGAGSSGIGTLGSIAPGAAPSAALPTGGLTMATPTAASLGVGATPALSTFGAAPAGLGGLANAANSVTGGMPPGIGSVAGKVADAASAVPGKTWANLIGAGLTAGAIAGGTGAGAGGAATGSAAAQSGVAGSAASTADDAMAWFKSAYEAQAPARDKAAARAGQVSDAQLASMTLANSEASDLSAFNRETFRPIQRRIAADAMAYDTPERRMQAAAAAAADVDVSAAAGQRATDRALGRAGVAPGSAKALAAREDGAVAQSVGRGASMTNAVRNVERTGNERLVQAASLGNTMAGQQATQQGIGVNAGAASVGSAGAGLQAAQSGNALMQQGFNTKLSGLSTAGNLFNGVAAGERADRNLADANARDERRDLINGVGQIGQFIGNVWGTSDKNKKAGTGKMADSAKALEEIEKTPVHEGWTYKDDPSGTPRTGAMAQDVNKVSGEAAAPGGKVIDLVSAQGRMAAAIQQLSKDVKALKKERATA